MKTKDTLKRHVWSVHEGEKPPDHCTKCEGKCQAKLSFPTSKDKRINILQCHMVNDKNHSSIVCSTCGKEFSRIDRLKTHVEASKCSKEQSKIHLVTSNEEKQPWDSCKILFSEESNGERFECPFCKTLYSTKKSLKRHVLSVHEGVKPHKCTICEARYISPCFLKSHMLSAHQSDKPYKCELCKAKFKIQPHLNKHMKNVHKIENRKNTRANEIENLSTLEKEDSLEYQLPYGWKKVCHHRPTLHGRFMVLGNARKKFLQHLRTLYSRVRNKSRPYGY